MERFCFRRYEYVDDHHLSGATLNQKIGEFIDSTIR